MSTAEEYPFSDVCACLGVCWMGKNIDRFIVCHEITSITDFEITEMSNVEMIVKMYNDHYIMAEQNMVLNVQKKLKAFRSHNGLFVMYLVAHQINECFEFLLHV